MELLLNRLIDGLTLGSVYALLAMSMAVVIKGTRHLNFAQGEMAMFSAFVVLALTAAGLPLWLAALLGVLVGALLAGVVDFALIRPFEGKSGQAIILVTIGLYLLVNALAGVIWGVDPQAFPSLFPEEYVEVFGARLYYSDIGAFLILAVVVLVVWLITEKTGLGLRMRAVASNPASARLSGVRVPLMNAVSWGIGGGIGAVAGLVVASSTQISPSMLTDVFVYALAAATLGGLDSIKGAVLAGLVLGVFSELLSGYLPFIGSAFKQPVILALIVVVLLVKPTGVFGSQKVVRV